MGIEEQWNGAANIMVVVFRPFHIGDRVETDGVTGIARLESRVLWPANEDIYPAISRLRTLIERDARVVKISAIGIDALESDKYTLAAQVWTQRESLLPLKYDLNRSIKEEFDPEPAPVERRAGR